MANPWLQSFSDRSLTGVHWPLGYDVKNETASVRSTSLIHIFVAVAAVLCWAYWIGLPWWRNHGQQCECSAATIETGPRFATRASIAAAFKCTVERLVRVELGEMPTIDQNSSGRHDR